MNDFLHFARWLKYSIGDEASSVLNKHGFDKVFVETIEGVDSGRSTPRSRDLIRVLHRVSNIFQAHGISYCAVKGLVCDNLFYGGHGLRKMNDLDFAIDEENIAFAKELLLREGFVRGEYDFDGAGDFKECSRHEEVYREMYTHETIPFTYFGKNLEGGLGVTVDLNFLFSWPAYGLSREANRKLMKKALKTRKIVSLFGQEMYRFSDELLAVHIVMHTFNDCKKFLYEDLRWGAFDSPCKHVRLKGVYESYCCRNLFDRKDLIWNEFSQDLSEAFDFCDALCSLIDDERVDGIQVDSLDEFYDRSGNLRSWKTKFVDRLRLEFEPVAEMASIIDLDLND